MRRGWVWLAAVCLLLGGCTGKGGQRAEEAPAAPEGLTMELEHGVYDPSLTTYTYMIRNDTDETVEFGEPYSIQRKDGEGWTDLTMKGNAGLAMPWLRGRPWRCPAALQTMRKHPGLGSTGW